MTQTANIQICAGCGEKNPVTAKICTMCSAPLSTPTQSASAQPLDPRQNSLSVDVKALQNSSQLPLQGTQKPDAPRSKLNTDFMDLGLHIVGGFIFVAGAVLWCGNVFGFYRTFPGVGYITMLIGGGLFKMGSSGF